MATMAALLLVLLLCSGAALQASAQTSADAVLSGCGLALAALSAGNSNSSTTIPTYPKTIPWSATPFTLPIPTEGQLFTLHWVDATECVPREVARSYAVASVAGPAWEGVRGKLRPLQPVCTTATQCTILSQEGPLLWTGAKSTAVGAYVLDGVSRATGALSNAEQAARFLVQATFGPTMADITALLNMHPLGALAPNDPASDSDVRHFSAWIQQQNLIKPTLLRSHLRHRVSTRDRGDETVIGRLSKPCDIGSRWQRAAFNTFDFQQVLQVDRIAATASENCYFSLQLKTVGVVLTHVAESFDGENCTSTSTPSTRTYRVCSVHEQKDFIDDAFVELLKSSSATTVPDCTDSTQTKVKVPIPDIQFFAAPDATTTEVFDASDVTLQPVVAVSGAFIVSARSLASTCLGTTRQLNSFMGVNDGNAVVYYRHDRRRTLVSNTLEAPALITDAAWSSACADVDSTFVNAETCTLRPSSTTVCSTTSYRDGTSFKLDATHLRYWYTDSVRYVYFVQNLRFDDGFVDRPCTDSTISRWIRTAGTCSAGASTDQILVDAIRASKVDAMNPDILDITISDFGTCSAALGVSVTVDGDCWKHSHPNERDVYDFTQWFSEHEGGPTKISKWAEAGLVYVSFPTSHPMVRWQDNFRLQRNGPHTRLGRFGDTVEFSALNPSLQTAQMAARVNAQTVVSTQGFLACGSRGEEAGQPELGHLFIGTDYRRDQGLDRNYRKHNMAATYVWNNVALSAQDQLCHRTAWALAQIVVARGDDFVDGNAEPMVAFYDIFVQHCRGNYRDILREVSASPVMARYLTFHGNRAFAVTGTYPDENYAREVMQLFSIGVFELEEDGQETRDAQGNFKLAYTNTDIENGARVWTGWYNRARRGNLLLMSRTQPNYVDPVYLRVDYRDRFPKTRVGGGYLGDGYPLCSDLPPRHFLQQGAKFVLTGANSALGIFYDEISGLNQSVARDHFTPATTSGLYAALCGAATVGGACTFPGSVELSSTFTCDGDTECKADTLRTIRIVDASSGVTAYYKYIEPVCVYMSFFDNGRIIKNSNWEQCAAEDVALSAGVACCDSSDISTVMSSGGAECKYLAEPMRYSTASDRCLATHGTGTVCPANSAVMKQTVPVRDGFSDTPPSVPQGVTLRKRDLCVVSGASYDTTRWRCPLDTTSADRSGVAGPIVLVGRRPDQTEKEFVIDRVVHFAWDGKDFYFLPFASQALYDKYGAAALDDFNALFPNGTEFRLDRWAFGSDPTGEKGTNERWGQFCAAWQYQWTTDSCEMTAEIDPEGKVNLIDGRGWRTGSYGHLRYLREGSGNKFYVDWGMPQGTATAGEPHYPVISTNGACNAIGCTNRSESCICPVHVDHTPVYTSSSTSIDVPAVVRSKLRVGAFAPASYGAGIYTLCTTALCTSQPEVAVYSKGGASTPTFDTDTIFVLTDRLGLPTEYLKNVESTVVLGTVATDEVQVPLTSCNASSYYNDRSDYQCSNVYDGNMNRQWATTGEGVGSWIDLKFGTTATLTSMKFANRCGNSERSRGLRLDFSDGSSQNVELANNTKCELETFVLNPTVTTTFVKITVTSAYEERNNGAREIQFFGPAGPNGLSDTKLFNFRNAPHFVPNAGGTGRTSPDSSPRYALYDWQYHEDKGTAETHALLESLLQHHNTPPMIAMQLIQKLVTSNPSPRYVQEVVKAFKTGSYPGLSFSGEYGDLGATVAAVMLDREARVSALDLDPHHGKVREPLLKVLHMMRSMEYQARPGVQTGLQDMGSKIGQGAFQHPSVFSFFSPFYEPPGPVADAGLVSPEVEILTAPLLIGYLNGMDSLIEYGLTSCQWGFGDTEDGRGKRAFCRTSELDQTDDGRLSYTLPSVFDDIELVPTGACTASLETSLISSQGCFSAIDGRSSEWISYRDQEGAWIEIELGTSPVSIDTFKMSNRCQRDGDDYVLLNKDVALIFSDGTNMTITLFDNCTFSTFSLGRTVSTTFVRVLVLSVYPGSKSTNIYNGAREIELWMGGTQITPFACSASSENSARRSNTCTMNVGSSPYEGWVVQGSGVGSWVQKTFASSTTVGRVQFADRCNRNRPHRVLLEFSSGSSQTIFMDNDCDPAAVPITPVATLFVKATVQSVFNATDSACCKCDRFWRRVNDKAATSVACEKYAPGTAAEMRMWTSRNVAGIMDAMGTLLAPGRFSGVSRSVIGDAYERQRTQEDGLKHALKLFITAPAFNVNNDPAPLQAERPPYVPVPSQNRPYKAIVTIMLAGGADSYNMLVPHTCSPVDLYAEYSSIRGPDLTLPKNTLHSISTGVDSHPQPCSTFGLHPSLSYLQQAYNDGDCIVFANMGALTEPIASYNEYRRGTKKQPVGNFGHNGMQRNAMSLDADDHLAKGVLGRAIGVLSSPPTSLKSAMYSTASHKKILEGSLTPSIIQAGSGVIRYKNLASVKSDVEKLHRPQLKSVFGQTVSSILDDSLISTENLGVLLAGKSLVTDESLFGTGGSLGSQLKEVAKLIRVDTEDLSMERSGFIVQQGGYDTHATFDLVPLLDTLNDAIKAFADEMKAQGIWENITIQVISDFGRTLTSNSQGTDHAWGGNYFLLGGAVRGGRVMGRFPDGMAAGSDLDLGRGRLIATTPWEAPWNGLCEWMDIPASEMDYVLPNAKNFPSGSLYTEADLFGPRAPQTTQSAGPPDEIVSAGGSTGLVRFGPFLWPLWFGALVSILQVWH